MQTADVLEIMSPKKLFSYKGRISVLQYWVAQLICFLLFLLLFFVFTENASTFQNIHSAVDFIFQAFLLAFVGVGMWIGTVTNIKRTHDLGYSGWWALIGLVPFVRYAYIVCLAFAPTGKEPNIYGPSVTEKIILPAHSLHK